MNYRQNPRLNASKLKAFLDKDPSIAHHELANPTPPSQAMNLGTAVHAIVEHLGKLPEDLVEFPFDSLRTKAAKEWMEENKHKTVLKTAEIIQAKAMAKNILEVNNDFVRDIVLDPKSKREIDYYDDKCKALLDIVSADGVIAMDYKTTAATSAGAFMRSAISYGYALQAYHYKMMSGCEKFYFIAVSSVAPYPVWCIECSDSFLAFGEYQWHKAHDAMTQASTEEMITMSAPNWYVPENEESEDLSVFG